MNKLSDDGARLALCQAITHKILLGDARSADDPIARASELMQAIWKAAPFDMPSEYELALRLEIESQRAKLLAALQAPANERTVKRRNKLELRVIEGSKE